MERPPAGWRSPGDARGSFLLLLQEQSGLEPTGMVPPPVIGGLMESWEATHGTLAQTGIASTKNLASPVQPGGVIRTSDYVS